MASGPGVGGRCAVGGGDAVTAPPPPHLRPHPHRNPTVTLSKPPLRRGKLRVRRAARGRCPARGPRVDNPPCAAPQAGGHLGAMRSQAALLRGTWREGMGVGGGGSLHRRPCQGFLLPPWGSPVPKITTPRTARGRERGVWESQPPQRPLPIATRRTAGQDGDPPPPGWGRTALHGPRSPAARAPALLPGGASPCEAGSPGHPYG